MPPDFLPGRIVRCIPGPTTKGDEMARSANGWATTSTPTTLTPRGEQGDGKVDTEVDQGRRIETRFRNDAEFTSAQRPTVGAADEPPGTPLRADEFLGSSADLFGQQKTRSADGRLRVISKPALNRARQRPLQEPESVAIKRSCTPAFRTLIPMPATETAPSAGTPRQRD